MTTPTPPTAVDLAARATTATAAALASMHSSEAAGDAVSAAMKSSLQAARDAYHAAEMAHVAARATQQAVDRLTAARDAAIAATNWIESANMPSREQIADRIARIIRAIDGAGEGGAA